MKLPIKDEYFNDIKTGKKTMEYRDAHITFVNEKTGEQLKKQVVQVRMRPKDKLSQDLQDSGLFDDELIIVFYLDTKNRGRC